MREEIVKYLIEYRELENTPFRKIEPKLLNLFGAINCLSEVKIIFIENMLIQEQARYNPKQMETRDNYDSLRILNLIKQQQ